MNDINEEFGPKLLEKIKEDKIAPKPRWQFLLKKYVVLASGLIALLVGSLSTSVAIYFFQDNSLNVYQKMDGSPLKFIFFTLPYFWLIFLAIFIFILYYNLKHTDKGYRYSIAAVSAISIILSLFLGFIFFELGAGRLIDDALGEQTSFYSSVINRQIEFWNNPKDGRLTGFVVSQNAPDEFIILDLDRQAWRVIAEPNHYFLPGIIMAGEPIRMIGLKIDDNVFQAQEILPVGPGRRFFRQFENDDHFQPAGDEQPGDEMLFIPDDMPPLVQ